MYSKFHKNITLQRLEKFTSNKFFNDVNLYSALVKSEVSDCINLEAHQVPDLKRIPFHEAIKGQFEKVAVGQSFGPSWSAWWFRIVLQIPSDWENEEVYLRWNSNSEAMIYNSEGLCLQGFTGGQGLDARWDFSLNGRCKAGEQHTFYIEMACNGMFGCADSDAIKPPNPNRTFKLETCSLIAINPTAYDLWYDFLIISEMAKEGYQDSQVATDALMCANQIANVFKYDDSKTWSDALKISKSFLSKVSTPDHFLYAVSMAHMDSAWLWFYDITKRKCASSFCTQLEIMDKYPEFKFAASQTVQFEWVKEEHPGLYQKIKDKIKDGQLIPVGGTFVEMDGNLPSGEAFCRQFLYGQKFLKEEFGSTSEIFWLPDTFGYAAQLPQIMKLSGIKYFLTQKLSWNNINKFPHTSFLWRGLNGDSILTHFPPADTYCGQATVKEVMYNVKNHKDKEHSNKSLYLFGNGDGGGGPTVAMVEKLNRMKKVRGLPQVDIKSPLEFFIDIEKESEQFVEWNSELYFELHRGTYTSQAKTKKYNRKLEILLKDVEQMSVASGVDLEKLNWDKLWKMLLLNQFHDVLPGTSIEQVYRDTDKMYAEIEETSTNLKDQIIQSLVKKATGLDSSTLSKSGEVSIVAYNSLQYSREEIVEVVSEMKGYTQPSHSGNHLALVRTIIGLGLNIIDPLPVQSDSISIQLLGDHCIMENKLVIAKFDLVGRLISLIDKEKGNREVIEQGKFGNNLVYHQDIPLYWDNWDVEAYHLENKWEANRGNLDIIETGPLRVSFKVSHPISKTSTLTQIVSLKCNSKLIDFDNTCEWNENRRILKVEFPVNIHSGVATYDIQYGHLQRPTHYNTSHDFAKFEVCGHKFCDISEYGYGVALLNDCKYGYSTHKNVLRMSLLRAPKAPDGNCDIGTHQFKFALYPHSGSFLESDVIKESCKYNVPLYILQIPKQQKLDLSKAFVTCDQDSLIVDCIKKSEDQQGIIVRMFEALGGRGTAVLQFQNNIKSAAIVNVLEDHVETINVVKNQVKVNYQPFQVITIKLIQ